MSPPIKIGRPRLDRALNETVCDMSPWIRDQRLWFNETRSNLGHWILIERRKSTPPNRYRPFNPSRKIIDPRSKAPLTQIKSQPRTHHPTARTYSPQRSVPARRRRPARTAEHAGEAANRPSPSAKLKSDRATRLRRKRRAQWMGPYRESHREAPWPQRGADPRRCTNDGEEFR
jgi:hypothetical protein